MKIGLAPIGTGSVSVWLVDGATAIGPSASVYGSTVDVQPRRLFRAADARPVSRGNRVHTRAFTSQHTFASQALADAFIATHEADLDGSWDVLYQTDAGGLIATMTDTAVQSVQMTRTGVSIRVAYTLVGGAITPA